MEKTMDKIVAVAKSRGFVYPGSEIYGGLANTWDYGPLGVELKNNVKKAWWQKFVMESPHNVGVDCAILMNPQTWVASGHLGGFSDPLMDCKECHERFRADKLIEDFCEEKGIEIEGGSVDAWSQEEMKNFIEEHQIPCPSCGKHNFTDIRQFNLMFKTFQGVTEDAKNTVYLRPETAQGIFVNFKNVQRTSRKKIPFGIGQIGKSFRNEITPGNFTFRTREFEQMELEFFCEPGTDLDWFQYWRGFCINWLKSLGMKDEEMRARDHSPEELCFYSKGTTDIEFLFPFGWGELWGIADRTDYDLTQHQNVSGQDMTYFDPEKNEKYIPYVIEPSLGADRVVLAFLCSAYDEEVLDAEKNDVRTVMHFHPALAPVKIGVLPLSKKLNEGAEKVFAELSKKYNCEFDDRGNIGKRYRRQDEIGTPYCITYDFDSETDGAVTVRDRDTMEQERIKIEDLDAYFVIPVMVSERLVDVSQDYQGEWICISGQFRSYNRHEEKKNRLVLSVFARELSFVEEEDDSVKSNQIYLDGYICKPPVYRKTPLGREIADLLIAVNRPYGKSDYIPCICWGRNARYASAFAVGGHVLIWGRIQSREYMKRLSETEMEKRTAYEVSVSKLEYSES